MTHAQGCIGNGVNKYPRADRLRCDAAVQVTGCAVSTAAQYAPEQIADVGVHRQRSLGVCGSLSHYTRGAGRACRFSRTTVALTRSAVSNPSVKRLRVDASKSVARSRWPSACHSSVRLIAVRNSQAAVRAQHNANPWPLSANVGDNACHLFNRTGCRVHARAPQLGASRCRPQNHDLVLNEVRTPRIVKTASESLHHADRTICRAPNSDAPASEVTGPASNAATTLRPSTGANSKKFGVQSVGIGVLRRVGDKLLQHNNFR